MRIHMLAAGLLRSRRRIDRMRRKAGRLDGPHAQPSADSQQHSAGDLRHDRLGRTACTNCHTDAGRTPVPG